MPDEYQLLVPCPFCGNENLGPAVVRGPEGGTLHAIRCLTCLALGPQHKDLAQSILLWRSRRLVP